MKGAKSHDAQNAASVDQTAMDRWVAQFKTRDEAAEAYADLLQTRPADWGVWPILNVALMDRWSMSALTYIKEKAWKIAAA